MCGIVGYIGNRQAVPILLNGLKRLEYRGYDSAGVAVLHNGTIQVKRRAGKLKVLVEEIEQAPMPGTVGIGHTRWATHGEPIDRNAHPHVNPSRTIAVVHNGIVENFLTLREELESEGVTFQSDTDTEVIVHLIDRFVASGRSLVEATREALRILKGSNAIVVLSALEPDKLITARLGNAGGIVIGFGDDGEMFVASDLPAILEHTRRVAFLEPGQMAVVSQHEAQIFTLDGAPVPVEVTTVPWDITAAEKGPYKHFMLKEIHEQPRALMDTIAGRVDFRTGEIAFSTLSLTKEFVQRLKKIHMTACGTAYHTTLVGKVLIERLARIPVETMIASEFRYADPIIDEDMVVLAVSQSGETADTLAAMHEGRRKGATLWAIVNVIGSQAMRMADGYISMQVGPEISVASTKAYTAPLVDLYMLAILLADMRGRLRPNERKTLVAHLQYLPGWVEQVLNRAEDVHRVARKYMRSRNALYLGRGINMATAYEGALKLKEISYIHAEGYPAGEMKHGPIALLDEDMPVIAVVPQDPWYEKMLSQVEQAKSRGAPVIAVATEGDERIAEVADEVFWIPEVPWMLTPVVAIVPLQLFAYYIAAELGLDVDQPRNLAKSVTVE